MLSKKNCSSHCLGNFAEGAEGSLEGRAVLLGCHNSIYLVVICNHFQQGLNSIEERVDVSHGAGRATDAALRHTALDFDPWR